MVNALLGKKLGMTHIFTEDGQMVPVTLIQAGPCPILQVKTEESDGYRALQLGFDDKKVKPEKKRKFRRALKPEIGHASKANTTPKRFIREIPWDGEGGLERGQVLNASVLADVTYVDVTGLSKGLGFMGAIVRHGFKGIGCQTHGQSDRHRSPGSNGSNTRPGRVWLGKRMAGHTGMDRVTTQNLKVMKVDAEKNLVAVRGAVPGANGSYVLLKKALKKGNK